MQCDLQAQAERYAAVLPSMARLAFVDQSISEVIIQGFENVRGKP